MLTAWTGIATGAEGGLVALLGEEASWLETNRVKSFEVSSFRLSSSGNSTTARAQNKRVATTAIWSLLRVGRRENTVPALYNEVCPNSTVLGWLRPQANRYSMQNCAELNCIGSDLGLPSAYDY